MPIERRTLLACLALSNVRLEPQEPAQGSLYIPKAHLVEDRKFLHDFMEEFSFADLITTSPTLRITHIPTFIDRASGPYGKIFGHIARHNPQTEALEGGQPAVLVFRGPHSYISPTWYAKTDVVPTWNFAVVHASGKLKPITGKTELLDLLARLIDKNEDYSTSTYRFAKLPDSYKTGLLAGIIGFQMEIETLEGKFKLGQERSEADRQGILHHLESSRRERSLHDLTAEFYKSHPATP